MNIQSGLPVDRSIRLLVGTFFWLHMGSFSSPPKNPERESFLLVRLFLGYSPEKQRLLSGKGL